MLSTLLALFLLWVLYLWLDRQRLRHAPTFKTVRSSPIPRLTNTATSSKPKRNPRSQRFFNAVTSSPAKPQFPNSKLNSAVDRSQLRTPSDTPKKPKPAIQPEPTIQSEPIQPIKPSQEEAPSQPESIPESKPQPEINYDAIAREANRRRQDLATVSSRTRNELYRLTHGDAQMVDRLLMHTRSRNPDRSEQWIWEKVIRDLERDRGYR